jgi:uncharacterized membrane protein YdfJ with MMPL/SSD domain
VDALARLADRHTRRTLVLAAIFFVVATAVGGSVAKHLDPYGAEDPDTESIVAKRKLEAAGYRPPAIVVVVRHARLHTAATQARIAALERELRNRPEVTSVVSYYDTHSPDLVSRDGRSTYLTAFLRRTGDRQFQQAGEAIVKQLSDRPGLVVGGPAVSQGQVNRQVEQDLRTAELLAFPLLFLFSLLFFRSLVAALLPVLIGALAITGTFLALRVFGELGSISIFALNLTTGLGLGLSIDYSLFIVSRYREEIAASGPGHEAMRRVLQTAGRTVMFSSLTVAAALASLLIFPQRFLYSMGIGGVLVALLAATVALTVLPAVLTLLGGRVNAFAPRFLQRRAEADARPAENGFWFRLAQLVRRRPVPVATFSALLLIGMGLPFLGIKFNTVDSTVLPEGASARRAYEIVNTDFPPYRATPILVVTEGAGHKATAKTARRVSQTRGVGAARQVQRLGGGLALIEAIADAPYNSPAAEATVSRLRRLPAEKGQTVLIGGATAEFVDFQHSLSVHLPIALSIVIGATLVILFLMTGSVVLPVKSLVMNLLNLSAVFGLLVLIFQDGRLEGVLSYSGQGAIEQSMPILLFAVAFGLSTDYAVFLLSRIKEARDGGASDSECVAIGLERTGRIVTAAAFLFAIAVGAFATSQIIFIKENGVGTALAVLIDASIIRALLVPSLMELLGKWNWWAPAPLSRLHRRLGIGEVAPSAGFSAVSIEPSPIPPSRSGSPRRRRLRAPGSR